MEFNPVLVGPEDAEVEQRYSDDLPGITLRKND
jgi:hypothetical protein